VKNAPKIKVFGFSFFRFSFFVFLGENSTTQKAKKKVKKFFLEFVSEKENFWTEKLFR
jgi:hypothetical protein